MAKLVEASMLHADKSLVIRYEDLVADPAVILRGVCDGVGLAAATDWLVAVSKPARSGESDSGPDYEGALSSSSMVSPRPGSALVCTKSPPCETLSTSPE